MPPSELEGTRVLSDNAMAAQKAQVSQRRPPPLLVLPTMVGRRRREGYRLSREAVVPIYTKAPPEPPVTA